MNYQLEMENIINKLENTRPKLLLHACCGPCSSYVIELLNKYFDITIYYYNPNIYPEEEYIRRKDELKDFINKFKVANDIKIIEENYNVYEYYDAVRGYESLEEGSTRCFICYELRLTKAVEYARKHNFDYFTTTLSISPYKNSKKLNEIGRKLENKYNVKYLYSDFKKKNGYKRSLELSKEYNLYRQDYCGCEFSIRKTIPE